MKWLLQLDGFFYLYQVQCFCFSTVDEFKPIADPLNFTHIGQQQTFKFFKFLSFLKREKRSRDVSTHSVISAEKVKDMILILTTFFERRTKNPEITFMAGKKFFLLWPKHLRFLSYSEACRHLHVFLNKIKKPFAIKRKFIRTLLALKVSPYLGIHIRE